MPGTSPPAVLEAWRELKHRHPDLDVAARTVYAHCMRLGAVPEIKRLAADCHLRPVRAQIALDELAARNLIHTNIAQEPIHDLARTA